MSSLQKDTQESKPPRPSRWCEDSGGARPCGFTDPLKPLKRLPCRLLSDPVVQLDFGTRIMICQMQHTCTGKSLEACCSKNVLPDGLKRITVYHQRLQDVFPRFCLTSSRFSKSAFQLSWFCASTGKLYVLDNCNKYWLDCCDVLAVKRRKILLLGESYWGYESSNPISLYYLVDSSPYGLSQSPINYLTIFN